MKSPMHEAIAKKHGVHVKISVEPLHEDEMNEHDPNEGTPEEEAAESPQEELKEKRAGLDQHLTAGLRPADEEALMAQKPHGLHARVVQKAIMMKKKGK